MRIPPNLEPEQIIATLLRRLPDVVTSFVNAPFSDIPDFIAQYLTVFESRELCTECIALRDPLLIQTITSAITSLVPMVRPDVPQRFIAEVDSILVVCSSRLQMLGVPYHMDHCTT